MSKKVFTSQKLSLFFDGKEFSVQSLVSTYGAKYVYDEDDLPDEARAQLGREVQMSYKGMFCQCKFVRETNAAGTIYNLRFVKPTTLMVKQIEKDITTAGLPSPWMRGLPRLGTHMQQEKGLPTPVLAVVYLRGASFYLSVRNFTLGGLLLEFVGNDLRDLQVGGRLHFDLMTNGGDKLPDMVASVSHISAELHDEPGEESRFQFGMRFEVLSLVNESRYRGLIKEHCEGLRGRVEDDPTSI